MKLQTKLLFIIGVILLAGFVVAEYTSYQHAREYAQQQLVKKAETIRGILMATRRVYHLQFLKSEIPLTEKTVGFLPAHAMNRISKDFANWYKDGVTFNNVSDRPRNPNQLADRSEMKAIEFFRQNPEEEVYFAPFKDEKGQETFLYAKPIWVEEYCLQCHGKKDDAPPAIQNLYDTAFGYEVGDLRGILSIKMHEEDLDALVWEVFGHTFQIQLIVFAILVSIVFGLLHYFFTRPLKIMGSSIRDFSKGSFKEIKEDLPGEFKEIGHSFNQMAERIESSTKALQENELNLKKAQQIAKLGHWNWDITKDEIRFSDEAIKILGLQKKFLSLPLFMGKIHEEDRSMVRDAINQALSGQTEFDVKHRLVPNGQTIKHIRQKGYVVLDAGERPLKFDAIIQDITDHVHIEKELLTAKKRAEKSSQAKSSFLAKMSHELRTPLNGILGLVELTLLTDLNQQQKKYLEIVNDSGKALSRIICNVLDISKIEAGKLELERVDFELTRLLKELASLFYASANAKGIELTNEHPFPREYWLHGDPTRLNQILTNLLGNAIKFTYRGSVVLKTTVLEESGDKALLRFEVKDTGIGISQENLDKIFEAFDQADGTTTRKFGGTGLGLNIVKQLTELMDGKVSVQSVLETGSLFQVEIPFEKPLELDLKSSDHPTVSHAHKKRRRKTKRALIVEDEQINQMVIQKMLEQFYLVVDIVSNGKEAVQTIQQTDYDIVFMDCVMPVMDGYDATEMIRKWEKEEQKNAVPIVALTGNAMAEDRDLCFKVGMSDFLIKPIFLSKIKEILEKFHIIK